MEHILSCIKTKNSQQLPQCTLCRTGSLIKHKMTKHAMTGPQCVVRHVGIVILTTLHYTTR